MVHSRGNGQTSGNQIADHDSLAVLCVMHRPLTGGSSLPRQYHAFRWGRNSACVQGAVMLLCVRPAAAAGDLNLYGRDSG